MWKALLNKIFKAREKVALNLNKGDEEKPFLDHLEDLRTMIVRMVVTLVVVAFGTFVFYKELFRAIQLPIILAGLAKDEESASQLLQNIDVAGPFMMAINVSLITAVIISFPLLLVFLLQFILPGLKTNEKKLLFPAIGIGTGLFLTGAAFAYWVVLPKALAFFDEFAKTVSSRQDWTLSNYVTFATRFVLVFGISFELPVVVMALVKLDILNYKIMKSTWRHALVAITAFAAIITPTPDVLTLMLMSGPLYVLYAICIWLAWFLEKRERQLYPEFYAERDKDEAELEKETDEWDKDGYTPWFSDEEDDDIEDEYQQRAKTPPPAAGTPPDAAEPQPSEEPPAAEKSLEELAREDEQGGARAPAAGHADPSRNED